MGKVYSLTEYLELKAKATKECFIKCEECPLQNHNNGMGIPCYLLEYRFIDKAVDLLRDYIAKNNLRTNAEVFKEMFGEEPRDSYGDYVCPPAGKRLCDSHNCSECETWWDKPYVQK